MNSSRFSNQTTLSLLPSVLNDGDDDDGQSNVLIIMATTFLTLLKLLSLGRWINVLMIDDSVGYGMFDKDILSMI